MCPSGEAVLKLYFTVFVMYKINIFDWYLPIAFIDQLNGVYICFKIFISYSGEITI